MTAPDRDAAPAGVASVPTVDPRAALARHLHVPDWWWCTCGQFWRGDAETGGCDAVLLAREVVTLREQVETLRGRFIRADDRVALLEAEREDREDYARMRVKQYSAEVSGPNLAEAEAELAALRERAERAERMCDSLQEERDALWLSGSDHERRVALLAGLLREVTGPVCAFCGRIEVVTDGHAPDCRYVTALADGG